MVREASLLNRSPPEHVLVLSRAPLAPRANCRAARALLLSLAVLLALARCASADVRLPESNPQQTITVAADSASNWTQGAYDVWLLHGSVLIQQGLVYARSQEAVLWIERGGPRGDPPNKVIAYLEGEVSIEFQESATGVQPAGALTGKLTDKSWLGRFYSVSPIAMRVSNPGLEPRAKPAVYAHALAARESQSSAPVRLAQFPESVIAPPAVVSPTTGTVRVQILPRSDVRPHFQAFLNQTTNEWVAMGTGGVNIVVDNLPGYGSIDVAADSVVVWTQGQLNLGATTTQPADQPLELYLEGNVVFRQGERVVYANRLFYNVRQQSGTVLNAELLTPVPQYEGLLRLRADVLQQVNQDRFIAQNGSLTSSRFGVPTYEMRSGTITLDDIQQPVIDPATGAPQVDPATGAPIVNHQRLATSNNNVLYLEQIPIFYWPTIATDLDEPNYYINGFRFKNDRVFGTQLFTDLDTYQLLGVRDRPQGTRWITSTDYLSKRGPALGTTFVYNRDSFLTIPGHTTGLFDAYGIHDTGVDNLGRTRNALVPETEWRGRVFWQHRQYLPNNFQVTGELGLVTDNNFLEQYFEREWDQFKSESTDIELKQYIDNTTWSGFLSARPLGFVTDTEWLPRLDHYWLGQSLLGDRLTWFEHSSVGYGVYLPARAPQNPADAAGWVPLPWEIQAQGVRATTRQELDLPVDAGPFKVVPYALGEVGYWGQVLDGTDQGRAFGQVGARLSLPFWSAEPLVESELFNVHGIAHKVVLTADASVAQADEPLQNFPLYDNIDDYNIQNYRRRYSLIDFGVPQPLGGIWTPPQFDPRFWALRNGLASSVASPATEIAGDMETVRLSAQQRWQTKRGAPGNQQIVDWITLDTEGVFFPDPNRDNFGQVFGLLTYNFRWLVGDRFTLTSDAYYDFYPNAPHYITVGGFLNRPPRGNIYLGFRSIEGPIDSNVIAASYAYRMSSKWISTFGTTFDVTQRGNIGQNLTLTRVGESFLFSFNINVDASKGNVGANFSLQPRFLPLNRAPFGGVAIPSSGAYGLE